jgi:hypothetical protein
VTTMQTDLPRYQLVIGGQPAEAVHEYTQTKAIWVELTGGARDPFTLG